MRDAKFISSNLEIEEAFVIRNDGQRKETAEKRLLRCVLFIDSW